MNVVAIHSLAADKESQGNKLAKALGVTAFEALSRLRTPGKGPLVVAVFSETEPGHQLVRDLRTAGFSASLLTADEISAEVGLPSVRSFRIGQDNIRAELPRKGSVDISCRDIRVILRGTRVALSTSTETVKKRSFNLGRAVVSGGLILSKTTRTVRETTKEAREGFFVLYAGDGAAIVFNENGIVYDSLGPALRPTRAANFAYLVTEIRQRCENAVYDERLLTRASQAALLGPRLSPEAHLSVATCLLAKVLRG